MDCDNIPPTGEDDGSNEVDPSGTDQTKRDTGVDSKGQLEASPSDSENSASSSKSSSNGGPEGENISGSEDQDVRSKIDQLRSVATLLKRKADELEAAL